MASPNTLRILVAGVGFWGRTWLPVVRESPHWELVALVDTDDEALAEAAAEGRLDPSACFDSVAEAAAALACDAALVVAPPPAHAPLAHEALESGLHCLIEKPFTTSLADARLVVERAEAAGRVLMVSQQYRHRRGARTVAGLLDTGAVGRVGAAYVTFANELPAPGFQHRMAEPLLWDVAIHHFDLVRGILGLEPSRVQATSWNPSWSAFEGHASATAVLATADGVTVTFTGTLAPRGRTTGWDAVWRIVGEHGSIRWDGDDVVLRPLERPLHAKIQRRLLRRDWKGRRVSPMPVPDGDRAGVLAELAAAIHEGREPESSGRDNIRSLALTVAAVESARQGRTVDIAELS